MTLEVRLRPEAELDLAEATFWYEGQQKGLGRQFLSEALALLCDCGNAATASCRTPKHTSGFASAVSFLAFIIEQRLLRLLLSQSCMAAEIQIGGKRANNSVKTAMALACQPDSGSLGCGGFEP